MKDIYQILADLKISYKKYDHPAVYTCEQAHQYYQKMEGGHLKNLFFRNKKGDKHYLVIVPSDKKVDLKMLTGIVKEKKISFASPERLLNVLGLTTGSVTPFGLINDANKNVTVVLDEDLWINTATLGIKTEDFKKFLQWCGNKVVVTKV